MLASSATALGLWTLFVWGMATWAQSETFDTLGYLWWQLLILGAVVVASFVILRASRSRTAWIHYLYGMLTPAVATFVGYTLAQDQSRDWLAVVVWTSLTLIPLPGVVWRPES